MRKLIGTGNWTAQVNWRNFHQINWHKTGIGASIDANDEAAKLLEDQNIS